MFPNDDESQFCVPSEMGNGRSRRVKLGDSIEICFYDMQLLRDVQLAGKTQGDAYILKFCIGEGMMWKETISGQTMELTKSTGVLCHAGETNEACVYEKNRHYQGLTLSFSPERFSDYFAAAEPGNRLFKKKYSNYEYADYILPAMANVVISETLNCPYMGSIRTLYLEGKALELLAVCTSAIRESDLTQNKHPRLSKMDVESIAQARNILDDSISNPISITALARRVCLNESTLKSGFKHIYGMPVYSYLLDKRLATARILLETKTKP